MGGRRTGGERGGKGGVVEGRRKGERGEIGVKSRGWGGGRGAGGGEVGGGGGGGGRGPAPL